jgi:putative spermidine/putrescine transport system substrate-binding protein
MAARFSRRDALKLASAGALAAPLSQTSIGRLLAADPIRAVTWGGGYAEALEAITKNYKTYEVDWSLYQNASGEVLAKTKAAWPNAPYDISENWDADFVQLYNEGWLQGVNEADIPNLANVPASLKRFTYPDGKLYAIPMSVGATYWGYRKDLVSFEFNEVSQLLDPRLKGLVCLPNITKGTGLILVVLAYANGGSEHDVEPGWKFLKELAKSGNIGRVANSEVDFSNSINSGETALTHWNPVLWTAVKKNWACQILSKADSKTLKSYFYQDGFVIYKGPRAKQAMDLMNFLLTPEANNAYQAALGQAPAIVGGKVPEAAADINFTDEDYKKHAQFCDYSVMSKEHDGWVKRWETEIQPLLRT